MKIYLIRMFLEGEDKKDINSIVKVTNSRESAKKYIQYRIMDLSQDSSISVIETYELEPDVEWCVKYRFSNCEPDEYKRYYSIEEFELDFESEPDEIKPELENKIEGLEKEIIELKNQIAELTKNNSAAQCWLTLYDGGKYDSREHLLEQMYAARDVLLGGEKENNKIAELFEGWMKQRKDEKRNCDVYRTFEDAAAIYMNTGKVLYNCMPKYTSSGDFVKWLFSSYESKEKGETKKC